MNHSTIELIESIVNCDDRTRRTTKLIAALALAATTVLLVAVLVGAVFGIGRVLSELAIPFGTASLATAVTRFRRARRGEDS